IPTARWISDKGGSLGQGGGGGQGAWLGLGMHPAIYLEKLTQVFTPLGKPPVPFLGRGLLSQLFAQHELGINQLECGVGIGAHVRPRGQKIFRMTGAARAQAAVRVSASSPQVCFHGVRNHAAPLYHNATGATFCYIRPRTIYASDLLW